MFNVGDKVVYPMHGAGTIDAIEERSLLNETQSYYVIKMPGEVKVMIPTSKVEEIGVRTIIDKSAANKVFDLLEENQTTMSSNWNKRYRDNMDKIKSGDIYEVADVVRNLAFKQKEKGILSTGEKKMLNNAKQILISELVLAEHSSQEEVEKLIDTKIEMSFEENRCDANVSTNSEDNSIVKKFIPFEN